MNGEFFFRRSVRCWLGGAKEQLRQENFSTWLPFSEKVLGVTLPSFRSKGLPETFFFVKKKSPATSCARPGVCFFSATVGYTRSSNQPNTLLELLAARSPGPSWADVKQRTTNIGYLYADRQLAMLCYATTSALTSFERCT